MAEERPDKKQGQACATEDAEGIMVNSPGFQSWVTIDPENAS
jgi:hypothetical protein